MVRAVKVVPLAEDGSAGSVRRLMGKVPSLVFDVDDLNDAAQHAAAEALDESSVAEVKQKLQTLLEPWSEPEYMLLLHVRFAREDAAKRGQPQTVPELADTLRRLGYAVKLRTALGGGSGGACLRSLRHSFLTVSVSGTSGSMSYVLDPRFRDQFEIAHATPRYTKILEAVGSDVVTTQDRLTRVVEILCSEMAHAFQETGTPLPPWRQHAAMLSKWLPRRSEEVDLTAALNNGAGLQPTGLPLGGIPGGGTKRLTGPSTVAQRLMMLGVVQQQINPSPIAEGVEHASGSVEEDDGWEALDGPASTSSSEHSVHLDDWNDEAEQDPPPVPAQAPAPARKAQAAPIMVVSIPPRGGAVQPRGKAILEGIRAAAAALPHRRNNTWAGFSFPSDQH
ncbi:expressed protein [Chlorella variabilis]|uniref:Expressed protein n=1 Tax=Chlorella variabilis TaxID=554065 RepID=E1ZPX1_CHLVA|nr:expressed protein [Chlorella variabilis]EFN52138.1 expressed protein [Chlorella variabilis]|eukprot:XP_005844240.1 expressed protein [Chlorella variabilis]